ncbi:MULTISPECIES: glycosyltransferase family 2 protein [Arenibacter]|uniref:glycosyltransferase family 2 protein n=1 Tax=Arenibacter TaxID=178469 RepID=UPI001C073EB2|nr:MULTISPECIES: glycosyltransferase family 2 protein [Arenibacter]MBU2904658.1 glycosyltransferase family 2 protein [Arenibacter algicola]MCK0133945.1 glycosyltransferase family 2 protein [Arenibacter sp. S6351L]
MEMQKYSSKRIAVVIPYYNASNEILLVISKLPEYIQYVIIVDDKSPTPLPKDDLEKLVHAKATLYFLENTINLGVGGATKRGFEEAIAIGAEIIIKVDADDQMDLSYLPNLLDPLIANKCDVAKGNRFKDLKALRAMPIVRRIGNLGLSFLIKSATGYWHNFDPTNGFLAIKTDVLRKLDFSKLANRYYFETSLLSQLYFEKAAIKDVPMPAIYGEEKSNMKIWKMPFVFGARLTSTFLKRIVKEYFLYDFNIGSVYLLFGFPLFMFGLIFGISEWIYYANINTFAPTGTIMIVTLSIILGFQLILQAIQYDIINAPKA